MRKYLGAIATTIGIMLVVLLILTVENEDRVGAGQEDRFTATNYDLTSTKGVFEDKEAGCKYLVINGHREVSITPLLKSDGTPDCD